MHLCSCLPDRADERVYVFFIVPSLFYYTYAEHTQESAGRETSSPRRRRSGKRTKQLISVYGKGGVNMSRGGEDDSNNNTISSSGYDRAIELLGGESAVSQQSSKMNDVQDEENLPPSYSEDTLLPRRHRNRMANLLRLERKQQAAVRCINSLFHMTHTHSQHSYRHTIDNNFVLENSFVCWRNHNVTVKSSIV